MLKQLLTEPSSSTLSNSAVTVTVHHLALLYTGLYSLSTSMLSTCLLSDVFQIEGCSAGLDVDATVCMWTQGDGWIPKGRIGCVRFATHLRTWRMNSISCLVAQLTVILDKSMPVFFSRPFLFQTFSPTLNQMHVVVFSKSVFHVGNPLYPPDIPFSTYILYSVCWPPVGPQDIKHKK